MDTYVIVLALVMSVLAIILFFRRPRPVAEKDALTIRLARAEQQVETLTAEKEHTLALLKEQQERLLESEKARENLRAYYRSQQEKLQEQKAELETIKKHLHTEFQLIANQILEEKTQKFTSANSHSLDQILKPLQERIKTFEEKVEKTYQHEAAERNSLKGVVQQLMEQSLGLKTRRTALPGHSAETAKNRATGEKSSSSASWNVPGW